MKNDVDKFSVSVHGFLYAWSLFIRPSYGILRFLDTGGGEEKKSYLKHTKTLKHLNIGTINFSYSYHCLAAVYKLTFPWCDWVMTIKGLYIPFCTLH